MPVKAKSPKRGMPASRGGRQKKVKKEGPKKALTAYMLFSMARREQIVKDRPELRSNVTEMSKIIGAEWRQMSDDDKAPYQREHERAKERYLREKEEFDQHGTTGTGGAATAKPSLAKRMENGADDDEDEEDEEGDDDEDDGEDEETGAVTHHGNSGNGMNPNDSEDDEDDQVVSSDAKRRRKDDVEDRQVSPSADRSLDESSATGHLPVTSNNRHSSPTAADSSTEQPENDMTTTHEDVADENELSQSDDEEEEE